MSRRELAEAVNTWIWETYRERENLTEHDIGNLERGDTRWPRQHRRDALRHLLGARTDAELGLYPNRKPRSTQPAVAVDTPDLAAGWTGGEVAQPLEVEAEADDAVAERVAIDRDADREAAMVGIEVPDVDRPQQRTGSELPSMLDSDLVELAAVLDRRGISASVLTAAELTCERLDQHFARLPPDQVLRRVGTLLRGVLAQLRRPQSLDHHRRLVTLASRLAGLRAWACFDINEHGEATRWYEAAVSAAQEAEAWSLGAWLLGAQSLIPWHRRDFRRTVEVIERGIYMAGLGSDATTRAWLHALEARGRASLGDQHGFTTAYANAQEVADYSSERDRRQGMDFHEDILDLRYYIGTSRLLLRQPDQAAPALRGSRAALPASHAKARAVLTLALADAAIQSDNPDEATSLTRQALTATKHQPIMPILQQSRRIARLIQARNPNAGNDLREQLDAFATALNGLATKAAT